MSRTYQDLLHQERWNFRPQIRTLLFSERRNINMAASDSATVEMETRQQVPVCQQKHMESFPTWLIMNINKMYFPIL